MNIEISDEQIQKILEKQISERVKTWFAQKENKYVIRDYVNKAVECELRDFNYEAIAMDAAKEKVTKDMMDKICNSISYDIASAYAEKYGDY